MAIEIQMKRAVKRLVEVFGKFAEQQGWGPADYRLLFDLNPDWGRIYVALVAHHFPGRNLADRWQNVMSFLKKELGGDKGLLDAIGLILKTFKEVEEEGDAAVGPQYAEASELW
jgi:hypothetical protein